MLWWKCVRAYPVDWQARWQAAYAKPWTDNTKLSCPVIDRNPISGIRNRWRRSWIREEEDTLRHYSPPRSFSRAQGQTQINTLLLRVVLAWNYRRTPPWWVSSVDVIYNSILYWPLGEPTSCFQLYILFYNLIKIKNLIIIINKILYIFIIIETKDK